MTSSLIGPLSHSSPGSHSDDSSLSSNSSGASESPPLGAAASSPYKASRLASLARLAEKAEALEKYLTQGDGAKKIQEVLTTKEPKFIQRNRKSREGIKVLNAPESMFLVPIQTADGSTKVVVLINQKGSERLGSLKHKKITIVVSSDAEEPLIERIRMVTTCKQPLQERRCDQEIAAYDRLEDAGYSWMPTMYFSIPHKKYGAVRHNQVVEKFPMDLYVFLARSKLIPSERLWISDQFIRMFTDLQRLGFAHRDIKPENVVIDPERKKIALIDLEMVCHTSDKLPPQGCGSLQFFSPEKHQRVEKDILKSDVYAIGLVLARICFDWEPQWMKNNPKGKTSCDVIQYDTEGHLAVPEPRPELNPLRNLIAKMCNYEPTARPSMAEVLDEWNRFKHLLESQDA